MAGAPLAGERDLVIRGAVVGVKVAEDIEVVEAVAVDLRGEVGGVNDLAVEKGETLFPSLASFSANAGGSTEWPRTVFDLFACGHQDIPGRVHALGFCQGAVWSSC